jgi:hypothetical protein
MPKTDKQMIQNPDLWPRWPWLPVKKSAQTLLTGLLCCSEEHLEGKMIIYHAYLYKMPETMEGVPTTEYPNVDAMLADGWVID